jgi:hypothetical protein
MICPCVFQMPSKALGTRPLDSVFVIQKLEPTSDAVRRCKWMPVSHGYFL